MEKLAVDDAKFESMIDRLRLTEPEALCGSGNKITKVCTNPKCKIAMRCGNPSCKFCGLSAHPACLPFDLVYLTHALNSRLDNHKGMVSAVINLDNQLITAIQASKGLLAKQYEEKSLSPEIQNIINKIYREKSLKEISGKQGKIILEQMEEIGSSSKEQMTSLINSYKQSIEDIIQEITKLKRALFESKPSTIDSKILMRNNMMNKKPSTLILQYIQFISESLGKYQKIKLIFRASEHNFRAAAFHEKCGEVENTLTLVKTKYNTTIAAFTPYKWHSVPNNNYVSNAAGGTCILSLYTKEKFVPTNTDCLIFNQNNYGPIFGSGSDLAICDQCNINSSSYARPGVSYNTVDRKYKNDQEAYAVLVGTKENCYFTVEEYQVFQVIR